MSFIQQGTLVNKAAKKYRLIEESRGKVVKILMAEEPERTQLIKTAKKNVKLAAFYVLRRELRS